MADPFSTIIGQVANLVSFKSALRLLVIAGSIIACWAWVQPRLVDLKIPAELLSTIIVAIGFSLGALFSSIVFSIFDSIKNTISNSIEKRKKTIDDMKKEIEELKIKNKKNELLVKSFDSYSPEAKSILLKLSKKDDAIRIDAIHQAYKDAYKGLIDGGIVNVLKVIDKNVTFSTINPLFKDTLNNLFHEKHKAEVNDLFENNPFGLDELILLFKDSTQESEHIFRLDAGTYQNRYNFTPVIKHELYSYEEEVIENCNVQFYFDEHHYEFMVEKLGSPLRNYILCNAPQY